jgi:hypothetical protein
VEAQVRNGDFSVEVVPHDKGRVRELDSGHVLARPGQVYRIRLRNHGPLFAVARVELDGHPITAGGLVLRPASVTELERPVNEGENGRFVVVSEGNEDTFGPDGGRDNEALGLIDARFRRELPQRDRPQEPPPTLYPTRERDGFPIPGRPLPGVYTASNRIYSFRVPWSLERPIDSSIERAAGTGLTGHSDQQFVPMTLGELEDEETVIRLRLVIGSSAAIAEEPSRIPAEQASPARPLARP